MRKKEAAARRACGVARKQSADLFEFKKRDSLFFPQTRGFEMKNLLYVSSFPFPLLNAASVFGGLGDGEGAACNPKPGLPLLYSPMVSFPPGVCV